MATGSEDSTPRPEEESRETNSHIELIAGDNVKMNIDSKKVLGLEDRELVRGYIVELVAIPAIGVSLIMFLIGFFVNEAARGAAYVKAYSEASSKIVDLASDAAAAASDAKRAKEKADAANKNISETQEEVERNRKSLANDLSKARGVTAELVQSRDKAEEDYKSIEEKLAKADLGKIIEQSDTVIEKVAGSKQIQELITEEISEKIQTLTTDLTTTRGQIETLKGAHSQLKQSIESYGITAGKGLTVTLGEGKNHALFFLVPNAPDKNSIFGIGPGRIASSVIKLIRKDLATGTEVTLARSKCTHNDRTYIADLPGICVGADRNPRGGKTQYEIVLENLDGSQSSLDYVDLVALQLPAR